jgi:hypothetical protein
MLIFCYRLAEPSWRPDMIHFWEETGQRIETVMIYADTGIMQRNGKSSLSSKVEPHG